MQTQQGETSAQEPVRDQGREQRKTAEDGSEFDSAAIAKEAERMTEEARAIWRNALAKMRKPSVGAAVAGAAVLAAGAVWGASEAAVAAIAAYAVFRMLRRRDGGHEREEQETDDAQPSDRAQGPQGA
jgi:hypothetical protein